MIKLCKNCSWPIDNPRETIPRVGLYEIGRSIYLSVLDGKFKSIDLCNLCYSLMQTYRSSLSKDERGKKEKKL